MKNKTILWIAVGALVLALLTGGLPLFSRLVFHRSLQATLLARQFEKRIYTTGEAFREYLGEKRIENDAPYLIPPSADPTVSLSMLLAGDMQIYTLNGPAEPDAMVIWYFPGGAYIDQPAESHWRFLNQLAEDTGAMIVVPIYPKLPSNDASDAYAALTEAYKELSGSNRGDLVFMGDSAGGGMALSFAMQLRDAGMDGPDKLILLSPWVDVTMEGADYDEYEKRDPILNRERLRQLGLLWADDLDPADPVVSPLYGDLTGLGEIWFFATDGELLYPDLMRFDTALDEAGAAHEMIERQFLFHCWPLFAYMDIPESQEAYSEIVIILQK